MAAGPPDEDDLVDELLHDDRGRCEDSSPPKRPKSGGHPHWQHTNSKLASTERSHSQPPASPAADGGPFNAASSLAAEAANIFSRLSTSSSGSPSGSKAAAEAAAAFAVGDGSAQPPGTIHPGGSAAPCGESAADLQRLHDRQWDWALAVHGSEEAALAAGWKAKDEPDYALYSVYMGVVRRCLESPDVEDQASKAGALLLRMVLAFRAYMACLYASGAFVMEHRYSNLETLSQLGELSAEVATLSGGREQTAYRPKGNSVAASNADSAARDSSGAPQSNLPAVDSDAGSPGTRPGAPAAGDAGEAAAAEASAPPARSRRSESAPVVRRLGGLEAARTRHQESSPGGDDLRGRRSLDLAPLSETSATRPSAEKLKKAYRDRATMDVRPTIAAINLSAKQRQEVLQRRRALDAELERSQADRKTLLARLQMLTMRGGMGREGVVDASAALRSNLDAEGRVITDFSSWFTCHLLAPLQHARCNATCYPYMPDVIGISDELAAETQASRGAWRSDVEH